MTLGSSQRKYSWHDAMIFISNISSYKINSTSIIRIRYGWIGRSVARGSHVTIYAVMTSATLWSL